jgi:hypothetical protein
VIDAEPAVRAWINAQATLVGAGNPLPKGAQLRALRSPYQGAYALLSIVGGTGSELTAEVDFQRARISAEIRGTKKEAAARGAVAYANALLSVRKPTQMGSAVCQFVDPSAITGPVDLSAIDNEPRYLVDADFYFRP